MATPGGAGDLGDIGDNVLPAMTEAGHAREWRHDGYWRDVATIGSYWAGHMDLLGEEPTHRLDVGGWPLRTASAYSGPGRNPATTSAPRD